MSGGRAGGGFEDGLKGRPVQPLPYPRDYMKAENHLLENLLAYYISFFEWT